MIFNSTGILIYSDNPYKLIVLIDEEISNFYRHLTPRYLNIKKPMHRPHISIVRNEIPFKLSVWKKYQNKEIHFEYDNYIYNDEMYYWINAYSSVLENIRLELGLLNSNPNLISSNNNYKFHITIGNVKHQLDY